MIRQSLIFLAAFLLGVFLQSALVHAIDPGFIAPDLLLLLVVWLGLHAKNPWGAAASFLLGAGADFATARFVGPNAAGFVLAHCAVVELSNRIFAERGIAVSLVTLAASSVKLVTYSLILLAYTSITVVTRDTASTLALEALFTAALAPFALKLFAWGGRPRRVRHSSVTTAPVVRR